MNNSFNLNRFILVLKKQWLDFGKVYLMSLAVLTIVLIGFYLCFIPKPANGNLRWLDNNLAQLSFRIPIFLFLGFIFMSVVASTYFNGLGQKSKAIMDLMTPASIFEKFMASIVFTAILCLLSYLLIFYVVDKAFINYLSGIWENQKSLNYKTGKLTTVFFGDLYDDLTERSEYKFLYVFPFLISSLFLLGSVYFTRFHYIKTALTVTTIISLMTFLVFKTSSLMTKDMVRFRISVRMKDVHDIYLIIFVVTSIVTALIWIITYIRLKEKEV